MALTPLPSDSELLTFSHDELGELFTQPQREQAIQQAADLFWLATRLDNWPTDATAARIVKWGVLDMAWSLLIKTENKTDTNTPFSSERIGSYSYAKAMGQIAAGAMTGVEWFDAAVSLVLSDGGEGAVWYVTEQVFATRYVPDRAYPPGFGHDPSANGSEWWPT